MIGVGRVFELYRDGLLEDDDEVALLHEPESTGYRAVSEAMVNLRDRLDAAVAAAVLDRAAADALVVALKALPYPQRSARRLFALAPSTLAAPLEAFVRAAGPSLKERDALALLARMAKGDSPTEAPTRVERTVFLERLRLEVQRERWTALSSTPAQSSATSTGTPGDAARALLALLARDHAALIGVSPSPDDLQAAVRDFQLARELLTPAALEGWLEKRGISVDRFFELAAEHATVRKLELLYRAEIDRRLYDQVEWTLPKR
jgi:hypothetical protein